LPHLRQFPLQKYLKLKLIGLDGCDRGFVSVTALGITSLHSCAQSNNQVNN
jgi:hypothetical protein